MQKSSTKNRLLRAVRAKHRRMDQLVSDEQKRPAPDSRTLRKLKKLRLAFKDQILRLETKARGPGVQNTT